MCHCWKRLGTLNFIITLFQYVSYIHYLVLFKSRFDVFQWRPMTLDRNLLTHQSFVKFDTELPSEILNDHTKRLLRWNCVHLVDYLGLLLLLDNDLASVSAICPEFLRTHSEFKTQTYKINSSHTFSNAELSVICYFKLYFYMTLIRRNSNLFLFNI